MQELVAIHFDEIEENKEYENKVLQVIEKCFEEEKLKNLNLYISITLTTPSKIRQLNKEYRNIDKETDVLSFPMVDYEKAGQFDFLEDSNEYFHPESGELMLGDIVISKEKVLAQAEEFGHSVKREYAFLIAHSMLHLFGYDHMEDEERMTMENMQKEILNQLQIMR